MKSFFILPLNVHLIKLLKLKVTPKVGMKLYLITNFYVTKKENWPNFEENSSITKSLVSEALPVIRVVVAITNDPQIKRISKY